MPENSSDTYIQDTQAVLNEFVRVFKLYQFYAETHPATQGLIKKLTDRLSQLALEIPLRLNLSKDEIFLGAVPLNAKDKNIKEFCNHLNRRRIYNLTVMPGFTEKETAALVGILSKDPKQIRRLGGVRKQLADLKITCFDIEEYFYDSANSDADALQDSENPTLLTLNEEMIKKFQLFLHGTINELSGDEEVFVEFLHSPVRLAELIVRTFEENLMIEDSSSKIDANIKFIKFNQECLDRLCWWLNRQRPQEKSILLQKVALSLLNQRFNLGIETLLYRKGLSETQDKSIRELTSYLTDEELLELLFKKTLPDDLQNTLGPLIPNLPVEPDRITRLSQKYNELMEQKKKDELDLLEMKKLQERFRSINNSQILSDSLGIMLELFETETQTTVHSDIIENLNKLMGQLIQNKNYDRILDILQTLNEGKNGKKNISDEVKLLIDSAIQKFVSKENLARVINYFENATGDDEGKLIEILSLTGNEGANQIVEIFINTSKIILRRPLSRILIRMGNITVDKIIDSLPNCPEDVARELITVLGHIRTKETVNRLKTIYSGLAPVLRQQAILMIGESPSPETRDWFIDRLKSKTEESDVQLTCLDALGKLGDPPSIQVLREIAIGSFGNKDSDRSLQHKAIQWLGRLNITEAVPDLIRLFRKRGWFPKKSQDRLKIIIAQTLWKMNDDNARQVVREGCRNMRGSVRRICETLVSSPVQNIPMEKKDV